jgi:hypothetical protein
VHRGRDAKLLGIFVLAAIPPAAILWFVLSPLAAALYVVAQTLFLWFGLRRRHSPLLRLSPDGLSYEPGTFQVVCDWADVDALGPVDYPDGRVEALLLSGGHLHWAADSRTRRQVEARGWDRAIPIGAFEPEWEWGQIGKAIRQWAPWIFELPDEPPAASP